jgi:chromate transporter
MHDDLDLPHRPAAIPAAPPVTISFRTALWYWFKLGFISFGGPAGQIALMHAELVEKRRWISEQRFLHALNYCMVLPGPEATQLAIYIGWLLHRGIGGVVAGALFVLPSLLILIFLSWIYVTFGNLPLVLGVLYGVKPAVVAVVIAAAWRIGLRTIKNAWLAAVATAALIAITVVQVPFPLIIGGAALFGWAGGRLMPNRFAVGDDANGGAKSYGSALIDDDTPTPPHARFGWRKLLTTSGTGIFIGLAAWSALAWGMGMHSPLAQMGWFFTKAALLTFGGAYAVLPYVAQHAVVHYHWLTPAQMIDGLALGETTPGPLIMIVAFVGFLGGSHAPALGGLQQLNSVLGACVASFFTFLPSFIFVLAGAPLIESTRNNIRLTAPLTAISAAVVGVIVSLAIFFAYHVFQLSLALPQWDFTAIAITVVACVGLLRFKVGPIKTIFACAIAGLVVSYLS